MIISSIIATLLSISIVQTKAIIGTNLGGWMVLEPWITPSLFYKFLGKKKEDGIGMDSWTFCEALGPDIGNKWMRAHWDSFYTEDYIKDLADRHVKRVRLPIGDWTMTPYGPYIGCMDGAEDKIQWMLDTCAKYDIQVLMDVHANNGSQNGYDNSGRAQKVEWTSSTNFSHWPNRDANWIGDFNQTSKTYIRYNYDHINFSIQQAKLLLQRFGSHKAFFAYEPMNEPWEYTDWNVMKQFYRIVRKLVQQYAPQAYFVFMTNQPDKEIWWDLFEDGDSDLVALDHHSYMAWYWGKKEVKEYCDNWEKDALIVDQFAGKYEVWKGEWALATDNCALWLGGLNDCPMQPQHKCKAVECPQTYIKNAPGPADFDRTAEWPSPYGTFDLSQVGVNKGMCWTDSSHFNHTQMKEISSCVMNTIHNHYNSSFMWTARNEIEEKWSYKRAYDIGWLNLTAVDEAPILDYIHKEEEYNNSQEKEESVEKTEVFLQ